MAAFGEAVANIAAEAEIAMLCHVCEEAAEEKCARCDLWTCQVHCTGHSLRESRPGMVCCTCMRDTEEDRKGGDPTQSDNNSDSNLEKKKDKKKKRKRSQGQL